MNPFLPLEYCIPDGEPRVFGDRIYLYGSSDISGNMDYCSHEYYVFSASVDDLSHWTNHGVSFASSGPNNQVSWSDAKLYAPDVIEKEGIYYLYFCLSDGSEGVATSPNPYGPFTNAIQMKYPKSIHNGKALEHIDPAAFVDDDASVYYYWGQFQGQCAKLKENMYELEETTYNSEMVSEEQHYFHEGSSMRKIGNTYYFIFCDISSGRANSIAYATGSHPLGPFQYQGVIISNVDCDPESWNNHGSIVEVNGQWYVFYHRSSQNSRFSRRACMEAIEIDENGLIKEVEMTSQGANQSLNPYEIIHGARACYLSGGNYIESSNKSEILLVNNLNQSLAGFKYFDFGIAKNQKLVLEIRIFKEARDGIVQVGIGLEENQVIGQLDLEEYPRNEWIDISIELDSLTGIHPIYIKFFSSLSEEKSSNEVSKSICKINYFKFKRDK